MKQTPGNFPAFQQYQIQFTNHIRNPSENPRPLKVLAKRMRVYTGIVFNNLESSVSACFPVTKKVLGARAWERLVRSFFAHHQCHSPLFRQIPEEFLRYLETLDVGEHTLPPYLKSLAHYEWIELALAVADVSLDLSKIDTNGNLLEGKPAFSSAMALLSYDFPVQLISPRFKPRKPIVEPVNLLVFRDSEDNVQFIELNVVTAHLLGILQADALTGRQALEKIAAEMAHTDSQAIIQFGHGILEDLRAQGAILGTCIA